MVRLEIERLAEGGVVITSPDIQGLVVEGRDWGEAAATAQAVARQIVEACREHGDPLPAVADEL